MSEENEQTNVGCFTEAGQGDGDQFSMEGYEAWSSLDVAVEAALDEGVDPLEWDYYEAKGIDIAFDPHEMVEAVLDQYDIHDASDHVSELVTEELKTALANVEKQAAGKFWGVGDAIPSARVLSVVERFQKLHEGSLLVSDIPVWRQFFPRRMPLSSFTLLLGMSRFGCFDAVSHCLLEMFHGVRTQRVMLVSMDEGNMQRIAEYERSQAMDRIGRNGNGGVRLVSSDGATMLSRAREERAQLVLVHAALDNGPSGGERERLRQLAKVCRELADGGVHVVLGYPGNISTEAIHSADTVLKMGGSTFGAAKSRYVEDPPQAVSLLERSSRW